MAPNITYEEALSTLDSMFGDPWTQDHLDTVLRHFQGHMENTVEAVLNHGSGHPNDLLARLAASGSNSGSNIDSGSNSNIDTSMDAEIARQLSEQLQHEGRGQRSHSYTQPSSMNNDGGFLRSSDYPGQSNSYNGNASLGSTFTPAPTPPVSTSASSSGVQLKPNGKKWIGTPTELPPDFLRIPGMSTSGTSVTSSANPSAQDVDADEALARMLQDSLFTEELANNPEFAHLARGRNGGVGLSSHRIPPHRSRMENHGNLIDGQNIVDKLSEMGENAKKRLSMFAAQWNAKKGGNNQNENTERRGLLDGTIGIEEERNVEMKSMGLGWRGDQGKKRD